MAADGEKTTRRRAATGILAAMVLVHTMCGSAAAQEKPAVSKDIIVTLLGTGGPEPTPTRFGPATLVQAGGLNLLFEDRKSTRLNSSHQIISYAVFCLKK